MKHLKCNANWMIILRWLILNILKARFGQFGFIGIYFRFEHGIRLNRIIDFFTFWESGYWFSGVVWKTFWPDVFYSRENILNGQSGLAVFYADFFLNLEGFVEFYSTIRHFADILRHWLEPLLLNLPDDCLHWEIQPLIEGNCAWGEEVKFRVVSLATQSS